MTTYEMDPTKGCWLLWIHFGSTQCSPHSVWGGNEPSPTPCTEPAAKLDFFSEGSCQQHLPASLQHNALPTCLCGDPSWCLSIPLGYNLRDRKEKLKQIWHCKTHTTSQKDNKNGMHIQTEDWSCNSCAAGKKSAFGVWFLRERNKRVKKQLHIERCRPYLLVAASQQWVICGFH